MSLVSIRLAGPGDTGAIAPLFDAYRQFYDKPPDLEFAAAFVTERLTRAESVILLACHVSETPSACAASHEVIGFTQLYPTFCSVAGARIFVLYDLFVAAAARGTGAGRALMIAAHDYASEQGAVRLDLSTAKTNRDAQSLYESLGWVRDQTFYVYTKSVGAAAH
jgi:ribosomal protein S18 acetylase RimI-like enzyme